MGPSTRTGHCRGLVALLSLLVVAFIIWIATSIPTLSNSDMQHLTRELQSTMQASSQNYSRIHAILGKRLRDCGGTNRPARTTRMRNNLWHMDSFGGEDIMVFSAFYDDRLCFQGKVFIRLLAVTSIKKRDKLVCQVWYGNFTNPLISPASSEDTGRGLNYEKVHYQERFYSCEIPKIPNMFPTSVSLHAEACGKSSMLVPVTFPEKGQVYEIGICVVVAYGELNPTRLVEWVELNKILGVSEINVYDSRINAKARAVLEYYSNKGIVKVHPAAPSVYDWCKWCQKLTVISALNDCMYRNMYRYERLMVIDFDEVIMPTKSYTLQEMLSIVGKTWQTPPPSFLFRNTYFFLDSEPKYKTPPYLITSRHVTRQKPSEPGYSPKSIIDPRRCMVMQNHYCMKRTPDVKGGNTLYVKPDYALSHHYKLCHFKKEECQGLLNQTIEDETALRYFEWLNKTVPIALEELKGVI